MIKSKADLYYYLESDLKNMGGQKHSYGVKEWLYGLLYPNYILHFLILLRKYEYWLNVGRFTGVLGKIQYEYYKYRFTKLSLKLGFTIYPNSFGPGLSIAHYGTIIVNPNAKIGANCRLHCGVNIGASAGNPEAPKIGDNVYIGPGAILFGNIEIGDNITIGANATVNKDCLKPNVVLAGTPAKIVKDNMDNWLVFNKIMS